MPPSEMIDYNLINNNDYENEENRSNIDLEDDNITDVITQNKNQYEWTWPLFINNFTNVILFDLSCFIYYMFSVIGWLIIIPLTPILLCCNASMFVKEISYQNYKNSIEKID